MTANKPRRKRVQDKDVWTWVIFLTHRRKLKQPIKLVPKPARQSRAMDVPGFAPPPPPTTTSPRRALRFATKRSALAFLKVYNHPDYVGTVGTLAAWVPPIKRANVFNQLSFLHREEPSHAATAVVPAVGPASHQDQPTFAVPPAGEVAEDRG
jgi:hypothetical protein